MEADLPPAGEEEARGFSGANRRIPKSHIGSLFPSVGISDSEVRVLFADLLR